MFLTKEPTNSSILDRESVNTPADALSLFFLFVHDRFMHQDIIERKIGEGYVVISDRYDLSSFCYQGPPMEVLFGSMEATLDWMVSVSRVIRVIPDITFLIDVDVDTALERLSIRRTRSAFESRALLERVRSYYLHMAGMRRDCVVLDGKVGKGGSCSGKRSTRSQGACHLVVTITSSDRTRSVCSACDILAFPCSRSTGNCETWLLAMSLFRYVTWSSTSFETHLSANGRVLKFE